MTRFVVTNASDAPIRLSITAEKGAVGEISGRTCPIASLAPLEHTADDLQWWSAVSWQALPPSRYRLDPHACTADIDIPPGGSVSIARELTYTGHQPGNGVPGQLTSLGIQGREGQVSSRGWEVAKRFVKLSNALYAYTYQ